MTLQARMQALLDLVEDDRRARCEALLEQADAQAAAALAQARVQARVQLREAFAEERERARLRIAAAEAELQTRRRAHAQRRIEALLVRGWQRLGEVLRSRWRDDAGRAAWVQAALQAAREALPREAWTIVHGPDWPAEERAALAGRLAGELDRPPQFRADPGVEAGLRIVAAGNAVDATLAGLLADRDEIGGRLIGELEGGA